MEETGAGDVQLLDEQLLEATRLSESGDEHAAMQLLLSLEPEHPEDATLLCMLGALSAHLGSDGMAADFFRRTLAQNPTNPQILVTAGSGLAGSADPAAEAALRLAALTAPELPAARMHYGAYLVRNGLTDQGIEELHAARALDPDDAEIRSHLGTAYLQAKRPAEALQELEAASADQDPDAKLLYGLVLIQEGDLAEAAEELHPVGEALADEPEVQVLLALLFAAQEWEEEAWLAVSRAEAGSSPIDPAVIREVEEALASGPEAARILLIEEVAPAALRDRLHAL
ncbi:MAG: tetratricopeptide repeat protein [Gemmatimonadota bacterium]